MRSPHTANSQLSLSSPPWVRHLPSYYRFPANYPFLQRPGPKNFPVTNPFQPTIPFYSALGLHPLQVTAHFKPTISFYPALGTKHLSSHYPFLANYPCLTIPFYYILGPTQSKLTTCRPTLSGCGQRLSSSAMISLSSTIRRSSLIT